MTPVILADAGRILFLTASAPVIGAALLGLIATLTGARWPAATGAARLLPIVAIGAAGMGLAQAATPVPAYLALWLSPVAVGARGLAAVIALWLACRGGAGSVTRAGVTLAIYAALVTPIASDWMLGQVPGHPVSAAGMMLVCQEVAAACALPLAAGWGDERQRSDLARLMVAAVLGLGYLLFVDYLIVWFGNLPAHVGFYVERGRGPAIVPLVLAMLLGWGVPLVALPSRWRQGRAIAGASVLAASLLVDAWWVGGGIVAMAIAAIGVVAMGALAWLSPARQAAHG